MSRFIQLLIGGVTLLPVAYLVYFIGAMSVSVGELPGRPDNFDLLFRLHLGTMVLMIVLLTFYIAYLFRTDRVASDKKALWAVVLLLGHVFAMPVFWFFYIWRSDQGGKSNDL